MPGVLERTIVDDARAARERRIVLREDGELRLGGQAREHGRDQLAGGALSLDEGDEPRRERRSGRHDDPSSIYAADEALVKTSRRRRARRSCPAPLRSLEAAAADADADAPTESAGPYDHRYARRLAYIIASGVDEPDSFAFLFAAADLGHHF